MGVPTVMPFCTRRSEASATPEAPALRARLWAVCLWLGVVLTLLPPTPAVAAEFNTEQRRAIEAIIKEYLTKNPDVLLDALQAAEDKIKGEAHSKASAALGARRQEIFDDPDSPVAGNPKG